MVVVKSLNDSDATRRVVCTTDACQTTQTSTRSQLLPCMLVALDLQPRHRRVLTMSLLDRSPDELRDPFRLMIESTAPTPIEAPRPRPGFPRHATADSSRMNRSSPDDLPGALQLLAPGLTSQDLGLSPVVQPIRPPPFSRSGSTNDLVGELRHAKREIEMLKSVVRPFSFTLVTAIEPYLKFHVFRTRSVWQIWRSKFKLRR